MSISFVPVPRFFLLFSNPCCLVHIPLSTFLRRLHPSSCFVSLHHSCRSSSLHISSSSTGPLSLSLGTIFITPARDYFTPVPWDTRSSLMLCRRETLCCKTPRPSSPSRRERRRYTPGAHRRAYVKPVLLARAGEDRARSFGRVKLLHIL